MLYEFQIQWVARPLALRVWHRGFRDIKTMCLPTSPLKEHRRNIPRLRTIKMVTLSPIAILSLGTKKLHSKYTYTY